MKSWTFTIPGPPVPKARPRRSPHGHWYTPTRTREYEELVAWCAIQAGFQPSAGEYELHVTIPANSRGDRDNILKAVMDGLNRLDGFDDRQIVAFSLSEAEREDTLVEIRSRSDD